MRKLSKLLLLSLPLVILVSQTLSAETFIHEDTKYYEVSRGVYRQNINRFTSSGWYNINAIKVDLTDPYTKLDTLFNQDGISIRQTTLDSAVESGAVSAINADYFSAKPGTNLAHSVGPVVQSGNIITTPVDPENTNIFAVFSLDKNNNPYYTYWTKDVTLVAPNGNSMAIQDINKFGWFEFLYMYDKNWGPKTIASNTTFPHITQLVVANNKVKSINTSGQALDIPQNGYVIEGDFNAGEFIKTNFKVGDTVKVVTKTTPNWSNLNMAVGGGSILVTNGKVSSKFSLYKPERAPQTSIGTSKDGKQAILVTVDGRQAASRGMTPTELANLMIELGAYNAIQLDSGGSTTMVSRDLGHTDLQIVNKYSDPNPRPVTNSIGVFSTAPKGTLSNIKIETDDTNIFANTSRSFTVVGYDEYYNPVTIDQSSVKWSFEGVKGKFTDNYFKPTSSGKGKVISEVNGITSSIDIKVLSSPVKIEVYPTNFAISSKPQWIGIEGVDKDGYKALISTHNLKINTNGIGTITDNYLRTTGNKSGLIKIALGRAYAYFGVSSSNSNTQLDGFEQNSDTFWGYPSTVSGNFSLTQEFIKEGTYSGRLDFDFSNAADTKGAYIILGQNGYEIKTKPSKIAVSVYTEYQYPQSIKAEFTDSTGKIFRTTFASSVNWTEWENLETTLPSDAVYPVKLNKIYLVDTNANNKTKGVIYFDDLRAVYNTTSSLKIPATKVLADYKEVNSALKGGVNSYKFTVYGSTQSSGADLLNKVTNAVNTSSFGAFVGNVPQDSLANITVPYCADNGKFSTVDFKNSKFITISSKGTNNNNGIRNKDVSQWNSLFNTLKKNNKDNIFILLDCPLTGDYGFSDNLEANLFKETLSNYVESTKKNIWVLYSSDKVEKYNENGVKYLGVPGNSSNQVLNITVNRTNLTYKFNNCQ